MIVWLWSKGLWLCSDRYKQDRHRNFRQCSRLPSVASYDHFSQFSLKSNYSVKFKNLYTLAWHAKFNMSIILYFICKIAILYFLWLLHFPRAFANTETISGQCISVPLDYQYIVDRSALNDKSSRMKEIDLQITAVTLLLFFLMLIAHRPSRLPSSVEYRSV